MLLNAGVVANVRLAINLKDFPSDTFLDFPFPTLGQFPNRCWAVTRYK